jgi:gliding motility-associated-like protein/uncharacterized repeat protein (TIGR01451 family)
MTQNKTLNIQLMKRIPQCSKQIAILLLFFTGCLSSFSQIQAPSSVPFEVVPNSTHEIRGELKVIGNTIIAPTIRGNGSAFDPNTPYDFRGVENGSHRAFGFIDVDGDPNTESSSSAYFERNSTCGRVVYAGLYWSATYYDVNQTTVDSGGDLDPDYNNAIIPDPRPPFNSIKFKPPNTPTGQYVDVVADRILYDGYPGSPNNPNYGPNDTTGQSEDPNWPNIRNNAVVDMPYHCYAEVTDIVQTSTNPNGDYFVADQKATVGAIVDLSRGRRGSSNDLAAGWTLVIIYEDPNLPTKYISTNYGLAAISGATGAVDFRYSGFRTVNAPLPVNARYGIGTYEGDQNFTGDDLLIQAPSGVYTPLSTTPENPANNFFDSTITVDGENYTSRNPDSENCLGFDTDIFDIQRGDASNPYIDNGQTEVNFRLKTGSDKYQVFVNTFEVEVIAPKVVMTKRVLKPDASQPSGFLDITDGNVSFSEEVFYELTIQNIGNEDVTNVSITDAIPANVDFISDDLVDDGITTTYTPPTFNPDGTINTTGIIKLDIEDRVIEEDDPAIKFRFRVRVVADCAALRNACDDEIENVAKSTYTGVESGIEDGDDSVIERDECDFTVVGASTFLINDDECFNEAENARLCRDRVTLDGRAGFETYQWFREDNPTIILATDRFLEITPESGLTAGIYIVTTTSTNCKDTRRRFNVSNQSTPNNPIAQMIEDGDLDSNPNADGNVRECPSTREDLAEIFLCGSSVSVPLDSNLGTSTIWQRLRNGACPDVVRDPNCPTEDSRCATSWENVFTGNVFTLDPSNTALFPSGDASGEYRILTTVDDDCPDEIYFNVFQSNINPTISKIRDIICGTPGALEVTSTSSQYEYQLVHNGTPIGGFVSGPGANVFDNITTAGSYYVNVRQIGAPVSGCSFPSNSITINAVNPSVVANVTRQPTCDTGNVNTTGTIEVSITGGLPTYRYVLTGPPGFTTRTITGSSSPTADFTGLIPGDYVLSAYSDDDDSTTSCFERRDLTVNDGNPFTVSITPVASLECNPDYNPTPVPPPSDTTPFDDDRYIAIVEVTITSTPASGNYQFSTNSDFSQTGDYIFPFETVGNVYRFRFTDTNVPVSLGTAFTIYVRDRAPNAGCVTEGGTTINPLIETEAIATAVNPPCFNELGEITVNVTAGSGPFTFLIDGNAATPAITPGTPDDLGVYTFANIDPATSPVVTVQDNINCDTVLPAVNFTVPDEIEITLGTITPLSCNANPNASIVVSNITGGSGNYEYRLDGGAFIPAPATPFTINNIADSGAHTVSVRNVVPVTTPPTPNCLVTETFDIDELLEVESVTVTPGLLDCIGQTTEVTLSATPLLVAPAVYDYQISPDPASGAAATGVVAFNPATNYTFTNGVSYTVVARRPNSQCTEQTIFTPANIPVAEIVNQRQTRPVSCNGGNDGAFQFTVSNSSTTNLVTSFNYTITRPASGSVPALNITVNNNTTNPVTITGSATTPIIAGTYTISITDTSLGAGSTGCTDTKTVVINEPDPITFTPDVEQRTCTNNVVSITNVQGGNGPVYNYTLFDNTNTAVGPARPSTQVYENVPNGNGYYIVVTDTNGCSSDPSAPFNIIQLPSPVIVEGTPTNYCLNTDGEVSFTVDITTLGTGAHTYTLTRDGVPIIGSTNINLTAPVSFTTTPPPALTQAGTYQFIVTDSKGCFDTINFVINEPIELSASLVNNILCNVSGDPTAAYRNGQISFSFSNGYTPVAPAVYTIEGFRDGVSIGTVASGAGPFANFQTVTPGTYRFRITDGRSCVSALTDPIELNIPVNPTYDTAPTLALSCFGDTGTVEINFNAPNLSDYEFTYNGGAPTSVGSTLIQIPNQGRGNYNYIFTNTVTGCQYSGTATVTTPDELIATITEFPITCTVAGNNLGSIQLDFAGGTPASTANAYTYDVVKDGLPFVSVPDTSIPGEPQRALFDNLDFGFYTIIVTDANNCQQSFGQIQIRSAVNILDIEERTVGTCIGGPTLDIYVTNGSGYDLGIPAVIEGFTIEIIGSGNPAVALNNVNPDPTYPSPTALPSPPFPPGSVVPNNHQFTAADGIQFGQRYIVRIRDLATGCEYEEEVLVESPAAPTIVLNPPTPEQCENADDGVITFEVDNYDAGATIITWEIFRRRDPINDVLTGTVPVPGGGGPITINSNTNSIPVGGGLAPGEYFVRVTEDGPRGCSTGSDTFVITQATPKRMNAGTPSTANCNNPNSRVIMTTNGGNPFTLGTIDGYRYARIDDDGSGGGPGIPGLPVSTPSTLADFPFADNTIDLGTVDNVVYHIFSIDANGCISGPIAVVSDVAPVPGISLPPFVDNACIYDNNYTFDATASAQTVLIQPSGTLTFEIDDANDPTDTPRVFTSDPAIPRTVELTVTSGGRYRVVVRDGNGCTEEAFIDVYDPLEFTARFTTAPDCTTMPPLGVIETTLDTGVAVGTLGYVLLDANGNPTGNISGATTGTFTQVTAGSYIVEITDPNRGPAGCSFRAPVSIDAPDTPDIDNTTGVTNASCNPATPAPAPNTGLGDGSIEVSLVGGLDPTATYQYEITGSVALGVTRPLQNSNIFNNLAPDTYTVRVVVTEPNGSGTTDDVVCEDTKQYTVGSAPVVIATPRAVPPFSCNATNNSEQFPVITIDVSGGTLTGSYRVSYTRPAPLAPVVDEIVVDALADAGIQFQTIASVAGTYNFMFKDNNNCEVSASVTVPSFNRLNNPAVTVTPPGITCAAPEEILVTVEGGTTGDTFTFAEVTGAGLLQTPVAFDNIPATAVAETGATFALPNAADETRLYRFRITNINTGCYVEIDHTVEAVDDLDVVAEQLNPEQCFGDADGAIRITVSGYTFDNGSGVTIGGPLNYVIINPDTGLEVVDSGGLPIPDSNGTLTMTTDPQTFDLPFGAAQGSYIVRVTQGADPMCDDEDPVIILGPVELELIVPPFITTTCDTPLNNGSFTATTNGAQGTVTYTIVETGATSTNGTFTGLGPTDPTTPRTYTVVARDTFVDPSNPSGTSFCEDTATIEVRPPANDVNITSATPFGVTCNDAADGRIVVVATGTDAPFTYTITPVITGVESDRTNNPDFTLLTPGDYIITVYDRSNCSDVTGVVTVPVPNPVTIVVDDVTDTSCSVTTADVALIITSDVAAPYTVEARDVTLRDVASTSSNPITDADRDRLVRQETTSSTGIVTFAGLPEGEYEFFAIDSNNCESQRSGLVVIDAPNQITATLDLGNTNIVCFGEATGSVNLLSTTGGLGNNMYYLDVVPEDTTIAPYTLGPQGDPFFTDLPAGQYTYRIESVPGSGCQFSTGFVITQPDTPFEAQANATNITCSGENDGTITVTATGGNTNNPYRFSLFNSAGERIFEFVSDEADNTPGSHVFEDLAEDLTGYTVIAEDGLGCRVTIDNLIIEEPAPILIDIVATTPEICAGDSDGTATLSITGGTPDPVTSLPVYFWSLDGITFQPVSDPANLLIENLPGGTSTVYIRDFNNSSNCEVPREINIEPGVNLNGTLVSELICPVFDYSDPMNPFMAREEQHRVSFDIIQESEGLGIIYTLNGINGTSNPPDNSNLTGNFDVDPGEYEGIMEFQGCIKNIGTIEILEYTPLAIPTAQMTNNPQDPNEYQIIASGGRPFENDPFYSFSFTMLDEGMTLDQLEPSDYTELDGNIFVIRETADYVLRVVDADGCEVLAVQNLTYINIRIPNYFTPDAPNSTAEERFWYPRQITPNIDDPFYFENMEVVVFDRYGRMLAEFKGDQQGWDGLYQGSKLPSGDYWYTIILNDVDNREFTGHFTLYR